VLYCSIFIILTFELISIINNEIFFILQKGNVSSTSSDLSLDDKTAIRFMIKKTKRFDYSIRVNDDEGAEQNYFEEEMNGIEGEESNISPSLYRLLCAELTEKKSPENQKNTSVKKNESDFVFLKPKVYQCYYCHKQFFHSSTYRRHMINQLKKLYWCSICNRGFVLKASFKRHRSFCHVV
jgi:hypothetical protein